MKLNESGRQKLGRQKSCQQAQHAALYSDPVLESGEPLLVLGSHHGGWVGGGERGDLNFCICKKGLGDLNFCICKKDKALCQELYQNKNVSQSKQHTGDGVAHW